MVNRTTLPCVARTVTYVAVALGVIALYSRHAIATDFLYHDNFDDGDVTTRSGGGAWYTSVGWAGVPSLDAATGDLVLGNSSAYSQWNLSSFDGVSVDARRSQWSFRTRVTIDDVFFGGEVFFGVGATSGGNNDVIEVAAIRETMRGRSTLEARTGMFGQDNRSAVVPYSLLGDEIFLQVDAFGDDLVAHVWKDGDPASYVQRTHRLIRGNSTPAIGLQQSTATIHDVWISSYPLPIGSADGDFNFDGELEAEDIDSLAAAIGGVEPAFDLNMDGTVDQADHSKWVHDRKGTWFGDSDLDGVFSSIDLVSVLGIGKYGTGQSASWSEGDWNGDGIFSSKDFVAALQDGGYANGPRAALVAVPEPTAMLLMGSGVLLIGFRRRRVSR